MVLILHGTTVSLERTKKDEFRALRFQVCPIFPPNLCPKVGLAWARVEESGNCWGNSKWHQSQGKLPVVACLGILAHGPQCWVQFHLWGYLGMSKMLTLCEIRVRQAQTRATAVGTSSLTFYVIWMNCFLLWTVPDIHHHYSVLSWSGNFDGIVRESMENSGNVNCMIW